MLTHQPAGSWSSGNRDNCTWRGQCACAERFPRGCSCHDHICRAWPKSGHAS